MYFYLLLYYQNLHSDDLYKVEFDSKEGIATVTFYERTTLILTARSIDNGRAELKIRIDVY